jgi:hypothetical protein
MRPPRMTARWWMVAVAASLLLLPPVLGLVWCIGPEQTRIRGRRMAPQALGGARSASARAVNGRL